LHRKLGWCGNRRSLARRPRRARRRKGLAGRDVAENLPGELRAGDLAPFALERLRAEFRTRTAHVVAFGPIGIEQLSRQHAPHAFGSPKSPEKERPLQRERTHGVHSSLRSMMH
jgi:hypothetical protein